MTEAAKTEPFDSFGDGLHTLYRARLLADKADRWADRMPHDRHAIVKLLRDKRDAAARNETCKPMDSLNVGRIAAFDAAIALLEAAEAMP